MISRERDAKKETFSAGKSIVAIEAFGNFDVFIKTPAGDRIEDRRGVVWD